MILLVLRGLPGCGKSTLTEDIMKKYQDAVIISNDLLRISDNTYDYNINNNNEIYRLNYSNLINYIIEKKELIIIDNCNLSFHILESYIELSNKHGYKYIQLKFPKPELKNLYENFKKSKKGLSFSNYKIMFTKYENHYLDKNINEYDIYSILQQYL